MVIPLPSGRAMAYRSVFWHIEGNGDCQFFGIDYTGYGVEDVFELRFNHEDAEEYASGYYRSKTHSEPWVEFVDNATFFAFEWDECKSKI